MPTVMDVIAVGLTVFGLLLLRRWKNKPNHGVPLPPGPKPLPIIGNLLDMPLDHEWLTFAKWAEKWGDLNSVELFGQRIIIVNSVKMAIDMMDKKSLIYSDRPILPMTGEIIGWKYTLALVPYGNRFRNYRKHAAQLLGTKALMRRFLPVQHLEVHRFCRRVLDTPEDFGDHIRKTAGAIILRILNGYEVGEGRDPFVDLADRATNQFSELTAPGAGGCVADFLPSLIKFPSWFPGAGYKKSQKLWIDTLNDAVDRPFEYVKKQMAAGTNEPSFISALMETERSEEEQHEIKWTGLSLYTGGSDTTVSAVRAFFLAMTLYPDVLKKAQAEVDSVVGFDRLPNYDDRDDLPYVNALCSEVHRWHAVAPTCIFHRVMEDDIHEGYFIPKGSLISPNIWAMLHDPRDYPDPMTFDPTRFLGDKPQRDPFDICFGFGRRQCPGKILADASVFLNIVVSLAAFDITKAVENGVVIEPTRGQTHGTVSHPYDFKCSIKPRSAKVEAFIRAAADEPLNMNN